MKNFAFISVTAVILYRLIVREQTKIRRAGEMVREQERIYREIFENNPQPMWVYAVETLEFLAVNDAAVAHYGYSHQEFLRMTLRDIHSLADFPALTASVDSVRGKLANVGIWQHHKKDSTPIEVEITTHDLQFNGRAARMVLINDITERRQIEKQNAAYQKKLRLMDSQILLIEEQERRALASALHDQIGQVLALAKIKLGALQSAASAAECQQAAGEIRGLLEQAINSSRSLTFELSPPILYELGLEAALQTLCEKFQQQHDIRFKFVNDRQPKPLADDLQILLFYAVRELLVNIVKHARASSVEVSSQRDGARLRIVVVDDGQGFTVSATGMPEPTSSGFGLFSIRERLSNYGGEVVVDSVPGRGTRVTLIVPLLEVSKEGGSA